MNLRYLARRGLLPSLFCCLTPPWSLAQAPANQSPTAPHIAADAAKEVQSKDTAAARAKLDEARTANPTQEGLWAKYAVLAAQEGKVDEAVEDLKKELANHPRNPVNYRNLAAMQVRQKRPQDAMDTLQKLRILAPDDLNAMQMLLNLQMSQKDYAGAETLVRAQLLKHPSSQLESLLATTLLRQGKKEEAARLLSGIAAKTTDPMLLNDVAYGLADDKLDLPLAEKTARRALEVLNRETMSLATGAQALLRSELLVSTWDTLGWALFQQGKAAEAEPWIRAAWSHGLATEPGFHLGMTLEKLAQPAKALPIYQMAAFGESSANQEPVQQKITERIAALSRVAAPLPDAKAALQALRVFKVPGANILTGQALVELELSAAGASDAMIVKDDPKGAQLTSVETSLYSINFKPSLPPGTPVRIVRRGVLTCRAPKPCEFALLSTRAALNSAN